MLEFTFMVRFCVHSDGVRRGIWYFWIRYQHIFRMYAVSINLVDRMCHRHGCMDDFLKDIYGLPRSLLTSPTLYRRAIF